MQLGQALSQMVQAAVVDPVAEANVQMFEGGAPLRQAEHGLIADSLARTKVQTLQGDKSTGYVGYPHIGDRGAEV